MGRVGCHSAREDEWDVCRSVTFGRYVRLWMAGVRGQ